MNNSSKLRKEDLLLLGGSVLMMASIFHKPLGLPDYMEGILMLAAVLFLFFSHRLRQRSKLQAPSGSPTTSRITLKAKRFWLIIAVVAVSSVAFPFISPYTGTTLPFPQLVIISLVTFVLVAGIVVVTIRRQK